MMKRCPSCGETDLAKFGVDRRRSDGLNIYCRECVRQRASEYRKKFTSKEYSTYQMEYRKSTPEREQRWKASRWKSHLKSNYGITPEDWERQRLLQKNKCAICLEEFGEDRKSIHVDHDHGTGAVRELLCIDCNSLLGHAKENTFILSRAIAYIRRHTLKLVNSVAEEATEI